MQKFDLLSKEYKRNPYPIWELMRAADPVVHSHIPLVGKVWMCTTHAAASEMLKDSATFVRDPKLAGRKYVAWFLNFVPHSMRVLADNLIAKDGEEHRRLRSLVDYAFQRQSIEELRPKMEELSKTYIDQFAEQLESGQTIDLMEYFARPFPLAVISELLGLPEEDRTRFHGWGLSLANIRSVWGLGRMIPGLLRIRDYLKEQIQACRKQPRGGLLSALITAETEEGRLSDDEVLAMAFILLIAGHETTVHLISTSLATLFEFPDQLDKLRSNWHLGESAIEECLRFVSPAELSKPRMVSCDVEFHGQHLTRGQYVVAMLGAANQDPSVFENPHEFLIDRSPNPHLSFGTGIHVCLGMKLARAEGAIALQSLFERFPGLVPAEEAPCWSRRIGFRSLDRLQVRLE